MKTKSEVNSEKQQRKAIAPHQINPSLAARVDLTPPDEAGGSKTKAKAKAKAKINIKINIKIKKGRLIAESPLPTGGFAG